MLILIRGAGDLASGVAYRLMQSGLPVVMTDLEKPTVIRRYVSFAQAIYDQEIVVEKMKGIHVNSVEEIKNAIKNGHVPVLQDPNAEILKNDNFKFNVVIDAILAKKNMGTKITDAPIVLGMGPGFVAQKDCHAVIETKRGHDLGRVLYQGAAIPNTGVPGDIGGYSIERVLRSENEGIFTPFKKIGDEVKKGDVVAKINDKDVYATMDGILRGILQEGLTVPKAGFKIGDIDPRCEREHCFTISDKARALGGALLEAILHLHFAPKWQAEIKQKFS